MSAGLKSFGFRDASGALASVALTAKEEAVLLGIASSEYGDGPGSTVYSFSAFDHAPTCAGLTARSMGGVMASLAKKRLVEVGTDGEQNIVTMTNSGVRVYLLICADNKIEARSNVLGIVAAAQ